MKKVWFLSLIQLAFLSIVYCQDIDFTLKYNHAENQYEVYALPNFSQEMFFVGGGSQLSLVLPADIPDNRILIETVAGGPWLDNSQVYKPQTNTTSDFHGIASNGSPIQLEKDVEKLLFTFQLPETVEQKDIRLFENQKDPQSNDKGMAGGDFNNFFACAFTMKDAYRKIYQPNTLTSNPVIKGTIPNLLEEEGALETSINHSQILNTSGIVLSDLDLMQNEPNPFKDKTIIRFHLPADEEIELIFRDEAGRLVKRIKEFRKAGLNEVQFLSKDVKSGLIIYQLITKAETKTRKMIQVY